MTAFESCADRCMAVWQYGAQIESNDLYGFVGPDFWALEDLSFYPDSTYTTRYQAAYSRLLDDASIMFESITRSMLAFGAPDHGDFAIAAQGTGGDALFEGTLEYTGDKIGAETESDPSIASAIIGRSERVILASIYEEGATGIINEAVKSAFAAVGFDLETIYGEAFGGDE